MTRETPQRELIVTVEADDDLQRAVEWYEAQQEGLARRLILDVDNTLVRVVLNPFQFPVEEGVIRKAALRRFPYFLYFQASDSEVVVLTLQHQSQHPATWRTRNELEG